MNIRDVARKARVSTATVSRVMSGTDVVSPETAKRVRKAIRALNYVPNMSARNLSRGRSHLFGIVISDITNPFFPELIYTFNELAEQHQYRVAIANTNYNPERMERAIHGLLEQKVEGIALMTSELSNVIIDAVADRGIPIASLHEVQGHDHLSHIAIDYKSGMEQAIDHVTSLGHERIAFIAGPQDLRSAVARQAIFLDSMKERGVPMPKEQIVTGNHRVDGGRVAMQQLLKQKPLPTAVVCSNDLTAIGAIQAICEAGLSVPGDISVVGYDDIEMAAAFNPALTSVHLSRVELATRAFNALYAASDGVKAADKAGPSIPGVVPTELVVRKSTAPPAVSSKNSR